LARSMAGYAIQTRIDGVRPRLAALDASPRDQAVTAAWPAFLADDGFEDPFAAVVDDPEPTLAQRLERGRELWSQTTFFLFDPNSWR
jgi:hypothetical protein